MLGPADQVVQLSVHSHKHGFERLIWLKDFDVLVRAHGDRLDWKQVEQVAHQEGVLASVWYSLRLVRVLLGTPISASTLRQLRPSPLLRLCYAFVWPTGRIAALDGFMRRRAVQFHAVESWRGMLPSLILMGRRRDRARAIIELIRHR
jgi:hypothetical protein